MPIKHSTKRDFSKLNKRQPEKRLVRVLPYKAGRSHGQISVRHKGGRVKRLYRQIDFKLNRSDIPAKVLSIEYDPNRSTYISLIQYKNGQRSYILAPQDLKVGDQVIFSQKQIDFKAGNRMPLKYILPGSFVHNIEFIPGRGGQLARSAGSWAQVLSNPDKGLVPLKLPSGEVRLINENSMASIGQLSNIQWSSINWGRAGRIRKLGVRPTVRGSAMNPVDHPHGGGEGKTPIGLKYPKTPWGKPARGVKTRKKRKPSDKFIVKRRK